MGITLISSSKCKVFLPSPFIHSNTINLVSFFSSSVFISHSLTHPDFFLNPTFLCFFFFPWIPAGDCSWRGRGGQGHGLTLGSIDDLCLCVFVLCVCVPRLLRGTFKFPQSGVSACHLGGKAGSPQYKEQSKHRLRISAASN